MKLIKAFYKFASINKNLEIYTIMKHPLAQFLYCPECGSSHFEVNNEKSKKCADCGFVYYFNPSSATVAKNKILFLML